MKYSRMKILHYKIKMPYTWVHQILFVFIGLALFSCSSLKIIGIEVAQQPDYPISEDIQGLVLLNRSMTNKFSDIKSDSLEKFLIGNKMVLDTVFQDSTATDTVIQVAARALFDSGRFDVVVPKERNIVRTDNEEIVNPLNISFINEICSDFKVDAVLVLESFAEQIHTRYYKNTDEVNVYQGSLYYAATDLSYKSEWRLYMPHSLKPVIRFQLGDSIFWKEAGFYLENLYKQMPRTKEALVGGGIAAGLKMSGYITPNWVSENRYYYSTGKKEIDTAIPLIKENKWEEAAAIWAKYETVNSKLIKGKVEFNLALAAEMNGDIDLAIEWGLKSFKTRYSKATEVYLQTLDNKRKGKQKETKQSH